MRGCSANQVNITAVDKKVEVVGTVWAVRVVARGADLRTGPTSRAGRRPRPCRERYSVVHERGRCQLGSISAPSRQRRCRGRRRGPDGAQPAGRAPDGGGLAWPVEFCC